MFNVSDTIALKNKIFSLVDFTYDGEIKVIHFDGVMVLKKEGTATVGGSSIAELARAFFLFALETSEGKEEIDIIQRPHFKRLGVMLSVQYPMKPKSVVKYMETMAALGYNYILLYMETAYDVKDYPFFGYMRGKYTKEELQYVDCEGEKLGIEVIPCIQTFGHMTDYLRWPAATPVMDNIECLLAGSEETYKFIDAMLSTVSDIFKTRKVHIGFDETRGMGLGRYLIDHDYPDRMELFCSHLVRVKEICAKYDLEPMMWSDMPFRLGGDGHHQEYDEESVIPEIVSKATADVDMCFWDYYNREYEPYDKTLKRHRELFYDSKIIFSGGVWVLDDFIMNMPHTFAATIPAMKACIDNGITDVNATIWGCAGNTNLEQSLPGLAVFSEYCYTGRDCTKEEIYRVSEYVTKVSRGYIEAISEFHLGYKNSLKLGARLIWTDILLELMRFKLNYSKAEKRLVDALEKIKAEPNDNSICPKDYAINVFEIAIVKARIFANLRKAYKSRDKEFLKKVYEEMIPYLLPRYKRLSRQRTELWLMGTKPFGLEHMQMEYGGIAERLTFAAERLKSYVDGEIDVIEELEQEILDEGYVDWLPNTAHYHT